MEKINMVVLIYACKQILKEETIGHQWFENETIQSLPKDSFGQFIKQIGPTSPTLKGIKRAFYKTC
jgi:hypothetical protein